MSDRLVELQFDSNQPQRLDKFLVANLPEFSRARLQSLIKEGFVTVDQRVAPKGGYKLEKPVRVTVCIPPVVSTDLVPEDIPLDILYEDSDVIVVNKPAGMVVHPGAGHEHGTLVHAALAHAPEMEGIGGEKRPGVVHRLDKDTSGIILLAKNDLAHRWLQEQFRSRTVKKVYLALVDGAPPTPSGRIEAPIGRNTSIRKQMAVVLPNKGRTAASEYYTRERFPAHTLLEVHPVTGRTHQIRLHLDYIGCPIAGDTVYGLRHSSIPLLQRHFLHAARLEIRLPGDESARRFEAPLPADLEEVLSTLRLRGG